MKNFFFLTILLFSLTLTSCKKDFAQASPPGQFVNEIIEKRYLPEDSATIQYQFDRDGLIVIEKSSKSLIRKGYRENDETSRILPNLKYYRLFTYNSSNQMEVAHLR